MATCGMLSLVRISLRKFNLRRLIHMKIKYLKSTMFILLIILCSNFVLVSSVEAHWASSIANDFIEKGYVSNTFNINGLNNLISKGYVVKKLLQIAEFSLAEEDILDKEGHPTGKKKLRDTSAALKALDSLCKYVFLKEEENGYLQAKVITISNLNDKKI